ncbi:hypothetical protein COLO4_12911 [Corchorus olitorius]|uniref:F-box associated beta-propeller type 1 domain-containing protein n=1 Tax=Corchorus olitorius TaxID=93759 RepID=A0A1R3JZ37_9ROSI|nr:hypothetical protein COLO4_12911 [Corchorus olitorius]
MPLQAISQMMLRGYPPKNSGKIYFKIQHKTLPRPNNVLAWYEENKAIGFGYDSLSNDYKVVFWYNNKDQNDDDEQQLAEVYTLGMNCWRQVERPDHDIRIPYGYHEPPAFLNGVIHWLGYKRRHTDPKLKLVISFNVSSEEFQWFPLPDYVVKDARTVEINVFKDMLCVVNSVMGTDKLNYDIWVMSEYGVQESWTKQLVLQQGQPLPDDFHVRDLRGIMIRDLRGIMMNGEFVWLSYIYNGEIYGAENLAVDDGKSNSKPIKFDDSSYLKFFTYTQSLVSLI